MQWDTCGDTALRSVCRSVTDDEFLTHSSYHALSEATSRTVKGFKTIPERLRTRPVATSSVAHEAHHALRLVRRRNFATVVLLNGPVVEEFSGRRAVSLALMDEGGMRHGGHTRCHQKTEDERKKKRNKKRKNGRARTCTNSKLLSLPATAAEVKPESHFLPPITKGLREVGNTEKGEQAYSHGLCETRQRCGNDALRMGGAHSRGRFIPWFSAATAAAPIGFRRGSQNRGARVHARARVRATRLGRLSPYRTPESTPPGARTKARRLHGWARHEAMVCVSNARWWDHSADMTLMNKKGGKKKRVKSNGNR